MKTKATLKTPVLLLLVICFLRVSARENVGPKRTALLPQTVKLTAACSQSGSRIDLDINNVRTKILGGGDMWWDLTDPKYEIPKDSKKHSLFAGSLWIGGLSQGSN